MLGLPQKQSVRCAAREPQPNLHDIQGPHHIVDGKVDGHSGALATRQAGDIDADVGLVDGLSGGEVDGAAAGCGACAAAAEAQGYGA